MSENGNGEFKWGGWTKPYDYLLAEARYGYGRKATDIVGYAWDADLHTPEETRNALKAGVLKATDPKARLDQHKIPERGVEDREGNEIHPVFASDPEAKEFDESVEVTEATIDTDRISRNIAAVVNEYADNLLGGLGDHADLPYMRAYSGRAMYGKYCLGVSVGRYDMNDLLKEFKRNRIPEPSKDALGMGAILYWQNIPHDPKIHINRHVKDESVEFTENAAPAAVGQVTLKQGDIIVCEWGVGMSLVDFYKVVSVSGDWVTLAKLGDKKTGDWASGTTVATSTVVGGNIRKKMRRFKNFRGEELISVIINASARQYGQLWDGRPVFYNTMD